jgi:hypothetical protein
VNGIRPVNLSATHVVGRAAKATGQPISVPTAPAVAELANWEQENYELTANGALTLGFPVASVRAGVKSQVLIFGTSRWKDVDSDDGHVYRYGVSLRVVVQIRDYKGDGSLTIPVVAAKVQLETAKATAGLVVRGYKGALQLPSWESFDMASYADYRSAVSEIQKTITSDEQNIEPELLATTAASAGVPAAGQGIGVVWALDAISHGESLDEALRTLGRHTEDDAVRGAVRGVYAERVGLDVTVNPDRDAQENAREELHGIHVSHGRWF